MENEFMRGLRSAPPLEFSARLRAELQGRRGGGVLERRPGGHRGLFVGTAAVLAAVLFLLPVVRTSAQTFLNLFRVVNFTAVPVDVSRIQRLSERGLDLPSLIGEHVEVLVDPGPPQVFAMPADASAVSGMYVSVPAVVPPALAMLKTEVTGERQLRIVADTRRLQGVLDALGITDVQAPAELNGQVATLRVPPVVAITYANGSGAVTLFQARSPEVTAPSGVNVAALGEIGLRIAGLDRNAAHTVAQAIDWRATLIVPVPAGVSAFRQVDVQGQRGLYVESTDRAEIRAVAWSKGGIVYGLTGALNAGTLLQMADSVQ
jgi:hypothetical protein